MVCVTVNILVIPFLVETKRQHIPCRMLLAGAEGMKSNSRNRLVGKCFVGLTDYSIARRLQRSILPIA